MYRKTLLVAFLGLFVVAQSFAARDEIKEELRELRAEVRESVRSEREQAATAQDLKSEDIEKGYSLIDVHGNRVRVEKYFSRPAADKIHVLVLNTRADLDNRIDRVDWTATFNKDLPLDLSGVGRTMWGVSGEKRPAYYVTSVLGVLASGANNITITKDGGWLFTFGQYLDKVWCIVVFNDELLSVNGISKIRNKRILHNEQLNILGAVEIYYPRSSDSQLGHAVTKIEAGEVYILGSDPTALPKKYEWEAEADEQHIRDRVVFADDTWISRDIYLIDDEGTPLPWSTPFWQGNEEVIHGASEFNGDTIDIVITPDSSQRVEYQEEN